MTFRIAAALSCLSLFACGGQEFPLDSEEPESIGAEGKVKTGVLLDEGNRVVSYVEAEEGFIIEGDILVPPQGISPLPDGDLGTRQDPLISMPRSFRWPHAVIPFEFDDNVGPGLRQLTREAMAFWENNTPVRFVRRQGQADYVHIRAWDGNYSYATSGYWGGKTNLTLQRSAVGTSWGRGLVAHELGHTMGLKHEQGRPDRDQYVTIHWDNIRDGMRGNFRIYDPVLLLTTYNVGSIMHYGSYAFSKNGQPTITRHDGTTFRQNFRQPTDKDYRGVTRLYESIAN